jgi:hypothetical protein
MIRIFNKSTVITKKNFDFGKMRMRKKWIFWGHAQRIKWGAKVPISRFMRMSI